MRFNPYFGGQYSDGFDPDEPTAEVQFGGTSVAFQVVGGTEREAKQAAYVTSKLCYNICNGRTFEELAERMQLTPEMHEMFKSFLGTLITSKIIAYDGTTYTLTDIGNALGAKFWLVKKIEKLNNE
jgi:hypothetical protein